MNELRVRLLKETFSIHRLDPDHPIPATVTGSPVFFIGRTKDELSIVCRANILIPHAQTEPDWACFMVEGPLDFTLTGIVARLSGALAAAEVSIFAISTFDTDYIFRSRVSALTRVKFLAEMHTQLTALDVKHLLVSASNPAKVEHSLRFFKTGPGEYGEGDTFRGIRVPVKRQIATTTKDIPQTNAKYI
jgi:uncharacterized protein